MQQHVAQVDLRGWIIGRSHENATQYLFRGRVVSSAGVSLSEIDRNPRAFTADRERPLIKCFFIRPITAPGKTSHAQAAESDYRRSNRYWPGTNRQLHREAENEDQKSDRWKIEPMLGDRGVELDDVGNRKIGSDKPARAEDAKMLSAAFFDSAINQNCEQ